MSEKVKNEGKIFQLILGISSLFSNFMLNDFRFDLKIITRCHCDPLVWFLNIQ